MAEAKPSLPVTRRNILRGFLGAAAGSALGTGVVRPPDSAAAASAVGAPGPQDTPQQETPYAAAPATSAPKSQEIPYIDEARQRQNEERREKRAIEMDIREKSRELTAVIIKKSLLTKDEVENVKRRFPDQVTGL